MKPCSTTGVGSLPFKSVEEAVHHVFSNYDIPFLPQLPERSAKEHLTVQFMEDFPGFKFNPREAWIELDEFEPKELKSFSFSFVSALPLFLQNCQKYSKNLKLQMTGPYTIANSLLCSDRKLIIDHPEIYQYLTQFIEKKAAYLCGHFPKDILFILDEPMLNPVVSKSIFQKINPIVESLKQKISYVGLHSCHFWNVELFKAFFQSQCNVLSFDISMGGGDIFEDKKSLFQFLKRGWIIWGIVPTDKRSQAPEGPDSFFLNNHLKTSEIEAILTRSLFSPACGTAGLTVKQESMCVSRLNEIAKSAKEGRSHSES